MSTLESHQESDVAASNKIIEEKLDIKEEEEYQDGDEQEMIANAMSGDKIKQLLSADGPTVKAVLLKCDGSVQEISYDSTPARNHVTEILGAPPSIIGQYPDLDVIVVGPRCQESQSEFELNKHKLRFPFNDATFYGDIFLYRFNQDCVCVDFTANEYKEFASKSHEDVGKVFKPILSDDQDVQDDDEEYDEEADAQAAEEFMRQVIINKVRQEYPQKFGREPTEQELEDMVNATLSVFASGAMPEFGDEEEEEEEEQDNDDDDDEEYDPNEDKETEANDEIEDIPNEEDLVNDKQDIEKALNEENEALKDVFDEEEEKIVNSEHFENELISAIDIVQQMAKVDKEKILSMTMELYKNETGMEPTPDMMNQAFELFAKAGNGDNECDGDNEEEENEEQQETEEPETKDEDVEDDIDVETFNKEMEEALKNVRNLGASHQKEFVNQISKTYTELNGNEPTEEQLSQIFGRIKEKLADEARDEFLEENDNNNEDDEEDGDDEEYKPNEQDTKQIEEDKKIDVLEELVEQNDDNEQEEEQTVEHKGNDNKNEKVEPQKVKILVTPVKRRPSGSRVDIYLKDQPDTNKTLEFASSKFEQINGRAPNENDTQRLKEFLTTGMLFESQMNTEIPLNDDDDEDDEDYNPDKDTFDYSKDIEDDMECENEAEVDENDDTSNIVDID